MGFDWEEILGAEGDDIQSAYDDSIPDDYSKSSYNFSHTPYLSVDERCRQYAEKKQKDLDELKSHRASIENVTFGEHATEIRDNAYEFCSSLKNVVIPEGITIIGKEAFKDCTALESVTIPSSVQRIKESAFEGTPWLQKLIDNTNDKFVTVNGDILIKYTGSGEYVKIPDNIKTVADDAFKGQNLNDVYLSYSIFKQASSILYISEESRFYVTEDLFNEKFKGSQYSYDAAADYYEELAYEQFWDEYSDEYLKDYGCSFGKWLSYMGVYPIDSYHEDVFSLFGSQKINNLFITDNTKFIEARAFEDLCDLKEVTLPYSLVHIGEKAFSYCTLLNTVNILGSSIDAAEDAFEGCDRLFFISAGINIINDLTSKERIIYFKDYNCEKASIAKAADKEKFFESFEAQAEVLHFKYDNDYKKYIDEKYGESVSDTESPQIEECDKFAYWCSVKGLVANIDAELDFFGTSTIRSINPLTEKALGDLLPELSDDTKDFIKLTFNYYEELKSQKHDDDDRLPFFDDDLDFLPFDDDIPDSSLLVSNNTQTVNKQTPFDFESDEFDDDAPF